MQDMSNLVAIFVSCLALLFTVFSFWWMHWRPGKLKVGNLQHFAAGRGRVGYPDEPNAWFIGLPLILFNVGASPLVLESLRLVPTRNTPTQTLLFTRVDTPLWSENPLQVKIENDSTYFPRIVTPNDAVAANVVFLWSPTEQKYEARLYHFFLEAKISGMRSWLKVKEIELDFRDFDEQKIYELSAYYKPYFYSRGERA